MSKSGERASEEVPDDQKQDSVFDFLYCDTRRIGSFLSQFDDAGHLQQIIERESATKGTKRSFKVNFGGGATVLGTGGSGNIGLERGPGEHGYEASERVYDPLWTNARTFLDYLAERDMIERDIAAARIGQFVLVSGELEVLNLAMLRVAWEDETIKRLMEQEGEDCLSAPNRQQRRAQQRNSGKKQDQVTQFDVAIALLRILPHAIQARLQGDADVWCNLTDAGLVVSADDLLLKHGIRLAGTWNLLGILDALPDAGDTAELKATDHGAIGTVGDLLTALAPIGRMLLGRPPRAYGLTPLLVFREVSG